MPLELGEKSFMQFGVYILVIYFWQSFLIVQKKKKKVYQQSFWIYRLSRHKIRFLHANVISKLFQNNDNKT